MKLNKAFLEKNKEYLNFYGGIILLLSVGILGPKLLKWHGEYYKEKVNKNGIEFYGSVRNFGAYKGETDYVEIRFYYKEKEYFFRETNYPPYIRMFDRVKIMIDTTCPENAYAIDF